MSERVTAEWQVDEVLRRYPATGPIFIQGGRMLEEASGQMYPTYPAMTVAQFADRNGLDVDRLLTALNAEAEARAFAPERRLPFVDT
ncbi:MAG TPA: hypothetical protein VEL75_22630, partial [Candidatus Methylomirabilis sp.]|nr:hypothetical protein [Candidatus Methylomirabilis sp.]